jgi:hypothetical protein
VGPRGFRFFFNLSKSGLTLKIKMGVLSCSKNPHVLHAAREKYWGQLSQLCRLQIPNRNKAKNPVTGLVFEF